MAFYKQPNSAGAAALDVVSKMDERSRPRVFSAAINDMMGKIAGLPPQQEGAIQAVFSLLVSWAQHPLCPPELRQQVEMFILDRSVQAKRCGVLWAKNQTGN